MPSTLIAALSPGQLDIVGDVHGELDALRELMGRLGYDAEGQHPEGRRLVFVGDLVDRGLDSPGVLELVRNLVQGGRAQLVLGNHEINLLRNEYKHGAAWYFETSPEALSAEFRDTVLAPEHLKPAWIAFLRRCPLALERADLRIVHAAWQDAAVSRLRALPAGTDALAAYELYSREIHEVIERSGLDARAEAERTLFGHRLREPASRPPMLEAIGQLDEIHQMYNPVRVLSSGIERLALAPFFASGRWRFVERLPWWDTYREPVPVIVGHYWRWHSDEGQDAYAHGEEDLFVDTESNHWVGARRNVFCVDFSVGARYRERHDGLTPGLHTRLGAVRWPERELLMEDGWRAPLS